MHPFGPDVQHRLIEALVAIREAIVDALLWFSDICLEMFEWLAQGQVLLSVKPFIAHTLQRVQ